MSSLLAFQVFLIPLRATQILTTEQINQIFSSLELIVEVNREVLKELENRMKGAEPDADIQIADIFAKMVSSINVKDE